MNLLHRSVGPHGEFPNRETDRALFDARDAVQLDATIRNWTETSGAAVLGATLNRFIWKNHVLPRHQIAALRDATNARCCLILIRTPMAADRFKCPVFGVEMFRGNRQKTFE